MTKEEKAVEFVKDFAQYGFRIDTSPTRMFLEDPIRREGQSYEYAWWHEYVTGAEKRLVESARKILEAE